MTIQPVADYCLIERLPDEERSEGGIYLPDVAREKQKVCKVIATGPGRMADDGSRVPMQVKPGDTVIVEGVAGFIELEVEGKKVVLCREVYFMSVVCGLE